MNTCLNPATLDALADGLLTADAAQKQHLNACQSCRDALQACGDATSSLRDTLLPLIHDIEEEAQETDELSFGLYTQAKLIARGGMAAVYQARAPDGTLVALKVCQDPGAQAYFDREVKLFAELDHLHLEALPPLLQEEITHCPPFFVLPLYAGGTLADKILKHPHGLAQEDLALLISRLASVLAEFGQRHLVHRDIKPSNILYDANGFPYLSDLGLARVYRSDACKNQPSRTTFCATISRPGSPPLTVSYMSPEQAADDPQLSSASDIFSFGVTLFEAACGQHPFSGKTEHVIAGLIQHKDPALDLAVVAPQLTAELRELILRCLAKDAGKRPKPEEMQKISTCATPLTLSPWADVPS